jgi:UMF1 family MFS transporter
MPVLERVGLHRPELRAWALYDWANSAFITTVVTAVFPPYFREVAAADLEGSVATSRFAFATTFALVVAAVVAPVLGALADRAPIKKRFLGGFLALGVASTLALSLVERGDWLFAAVVFGVANIGAVGSFVFYDALLPHIAAPEEMDRVSTAGYAIGYLGGGLLLGLNLWWISQPDTFGFADSGAAVRASFVSVGLWWLVFSIPLFRRVPEPPVLLKPRLPGLGELIKDTARGLRGTYRDLRRFRQAFFFMVAFLIYNDGIQTIIRMAAIYADEIGIDQSDLITAILMVQLIGIPCGFAMGQIAGRFGGKRTILAGLGVYGIVSVLAYKMTSATEFYLLAVLVALVQGGCQALSRSLFASLIPRAKAAEFFGLFAVFEKFAGIFGPALFGLAIAATGSSRAAILSVIAFFIVGGTLLWRIDVDAGRRMAQAEETDASAGTATPPPK